jgi:hypothetical protein
MSAKAHTYRTHVPHSSLLSDFGWRVFDGLDGRLPSLNNEQTIILVMGFGILYLCVIMFIVIPGWLVGACFGAVLLGSVTLITRNLFCAIRAEKVTQQEVKRAHEHDNR